MSEASDNKEKAVEVIPTVNVSTEAPRSKVSHMLQEMELLSLQKGKNGMDISSFNPAQRDKMLEILEKNEDNAYKYHTKKLETVERIQLSRISSATINQKTIRIGIVGVIIAVPLLTILILFFKENFFIPWLTFLTGLGGGYGLSKASKTISKEPSTKNPVPDDDDDR